jgi:hypothetical protein
VRTEVIPEIVPPNRPNNAEIDTKRTSGLGESSVLGKNPDRFTLFTAFSLLFISFTVPFSNVRKLFLIVTCAVAFSIVVLLVVILVDSVGSGVTSVRLLIGLLDGMIDGTVVSSILTDPGIGIQMNIIK